MRIPSILGILCILAGPVVAACGDKADEPGSSKSSGGEKLEEAGDKVDEAVEDTGDKVEEATE